MGKSIRSKRQKQLRTIKRKALQPSETLKVSHLNAKLKAYIKRTADLDLDTNTTTTTSPSTPSTTATTAAKAEQPIDPILLPPTPRSYAHPHPKPRDPADPTVRPYPRGRPRDQQQAAAVVGGRVSFRQALDRERRAMEGVEGGGVEGEGEGEGVGVVKVESGDGGGDVVEVSMLSDDDEDGNMGEVSYVPLGQPARAKRANKRKGKTMTRGGKKMSRSTAVVANWKRLGGGRAGLVS